MRLISYNVHRGVDRRGRPCAPAIADALAARAPDLLACQEVIRTGAVDLADELARRLDLSGRFEPNAATRHGLLGNAIFSRRAPVAVRNLDLSVPRFERRGALGARFADGLEVWSTHLGLTARQRAIQWRRLARALPRERAPLLVCGDFNDWRRALDAPARRAGLTDVLAGAPRRARSTFPAHRAWLALDRVYGRDLAVADARVLTGAPWDRLSDHLPVEVVFDARGSTPHAGPPPP